MKVKVQRLVEQAVIPAYAHPGEDAGLDLTATSVTWDDNYQVWEVGCGLAFEIPKGYVGLLFPRSSVYKTSMMMSNCVGVIDSGYRGEVKAKFYEYSLTHPYIVGERFAQMIILPYPDIDLVEAESLEDSDRGTGGHGSSGK